MGVISICKPNDLCSACAKYPEEIVIHEKNNDYCERNKENIKNEDLKEINNQNNDTILKEIIGKVVEIDDKNEQTKKEINEIDSKRETDKSEYINDEIKNIEIKKNKDELKNEEKDKEKTIIEETKLNSNNSVVNQKTEIIQNNLQKENNIKDINLNNEIEKILENKSDNKGKDNKNENKINENNEDNNKINNIEIGSNKEKQIINQNMNNENKNFIINNDNVKNNQNEKNVLNEIVDNKNNSNNEINKDNINAENNKIIQEYFFPLVGLVNVGSTCFMDATLQCLMHVSELSNYFLNEYPKDKTFLNSINNNIPTKGELSEAYYEILKEVDILAKKETKFSHYSYPPSKFKKVLGKYNSQFTKDEANDSKDLILYLLQTFHEELNYFGNKVVPTNITLPDQTLRSLTFDFFKLSYQSTNFSKISQLFYGTYETTIICSVCKTLFYSYQKFEFISFSTFKYKNDRFNILDGFKDNEEKQKLTGDNQYMCPKCKKLVDAETFNKIIEPPLKLILNIDYGKNKKYNIITLNFEDELDITEFLSFKMKNNIKYRLCSVCTHIGVSGERGHYIAFCKNFKNNKWYKFNDSSCGECKNYEIYNDNPYLLIYEKI